MLVYDTKVLSHIFRKAGPPTKQKSFFQVAQTNTWFTCACLCVCLKLICLAVHWSVSLSGWLSGCLSVCRSVCGGLPNCVCLSSGLSVYLSVRLCGCLSDHLFVLACMCMLQYLLSAPWGCNPKNCGRTLLVLAQSTYGKRAVCACTIPFNLSQISSLTPPGNMFVLCLCDIAVVDPL